MKCAALWVLFLVGLLGVSPPIHGDSLPPTAGVYTTVTLPPNAVINGINDLDQLVGTVTDSTGTHGFLDSNGVFTKFDAPGSSSTQAFGINNSGQIVGFSVSATGGDFAGGAFLDTEGSFTDLGGRAQPGIAINNSGAVVFQTAGFIDFSINPYLYINGTFIPFSFTPPPPDDAANVYATGINDSGTIVGSWLGGIEHEGFFNAGELVCQSGTSFVSCSIAMFPGTPTGINNAGEIVGSIGSDSGFLDRNGVFTALDFAPTGINNLGQIVGGGDFIFTPAPVPEPSTLLLLGCGLVAGGIAMKRMRRSQSQ